MKSLLPPHLSSPVPSPPLLPPVPAPACWIHYQPQEPPTAPRLSLLKHGGQWAPLVLPPLPPLLLYLSSFSSYSSLPLPPSSPPSRAARCGAGDVTTDTLRASVILIRRWQTVNMFSTPQYVDGLRVGLWGLVSHGLEEAVGWLFRTHRRA